VREGATAAEVTRDILDRHKVEVYGNLNVNLSLTLLRSRFSVRVQGSGVRFGRSGRTKKRDGGRRNCHAAALSSSP
jgi:hypothetical protein